VRLVPALVGQEAKLVLCQVQDAQQGRLPRGIAREQAVDLLPRLFGKLKWHRIAWLPGLLRRKSPSSNALRQGADDGLATE